MNCLVIPSGMEAFKGEIAIDTKTGGVTDSFAVPVIGRPPGDGGINVAVIVAVPTPTPVARPCVPAALLIEATAGVAELHCTLLVIFCVLLSV